MDGFIPVGAKGTAILPPSTPSSPAAATVATDSDRDGKEHTSVSSYDSDSDGEEHASVSSSDGEEHASVSSYPPSSPSPSCCCVSLEAFSPGPTCSVTQLVDDIVLPPILVQLLLKAIPTTSSGTSFRLVVADTSATDLMVPDRGALISYKSVHGLRVRMGKNSFAPVLGHGTAIISLNGQLHLISNVIHVPSLSDPPLQSPGASSPVGLWFLGELRDWHARVLPGCGLDS